MENKIRWINVVTRYPNHKDEKLLIRFDKFQSISYIKNRINEKLGTSFTESDIEFIGEVDLERGLNDADYIPQYQIIKTLKKDIDED